MPSVSLTARSVLAALLFAVAIQPAWSSDRIALVIGNGRYTSVESLDNPERDAKLIAKRLKAVGFEVNLITDASLGALKKSIGVFGERLRKAGEDAVGLFYYAGHGLQSFGRNYLLPVDAKLNDPADLDLVALEASSVLRQMYSARNRSNIVILDACRNNPFDEIPEFGKNGLAEMRAPAGTFLAYATSPGEVAFDGAADHSPFTAALADSISSPGLPIELVFKQVRVSVLEETSGQQIPWDTSSLTHQFYFIAPDTSSEELVVERRFWEAARASNTESAIAFYLNTYPDGVYKAEAESLIALLQQSSEQPAAEIVTPPEEQPGEVAGNDPDSESTPNNIAPDASTLQGGDSAIFLNRPIPPGYGVLQGQTLAELSRGIARFPPALQESGDTQKQKSCNGCHLWTEDSLCAQAKSYAGSDAAKISGNFHPYGGDFIRALRSWEANGCS